MRIILSPVPLPGALQSIHAEGSDVPVVFMDLSSLRRGGITGLFRTLRSTRAASVVVTGLEGELSVFCDILLLIALALPGATRLYAPPGLAPIPVRWTCLPFALGRILFGMVAGYLSLILNMMRLFVVSRTQRNRRAISSLPRRCLYLKPALNLGASVGGSVGHVAGVVNALHRRGEGVRFLGAAEQPLLDPGVCQVMMPPPSWTSYPHELNLFRYHRKYSKEARRQSALFRPDYVYQRYSLNDMTGIYLRHRLGLPLVLEFNGSEVWAQRHWGQPLRFENVSTRIEIANLRLADLIVVVSDQIRNQVQALGVPGERILFYPNCVDRSMFDPARFHAGDSQQTRKSLGLPLDADVFTFVGTFGHWHGTEVLAAAIRELIETESKFLETRRIHFLLVGDGPYASKVRALLGEPLWSRFVTLTGYQPQGMTPALLAASDVCLSPHVPNPDGTPFFGSPTKLFEYMAMAKLIVASDLDQIGWVLRGWCPGDPPPSRGGRSNAAAILVEPGDVKSLILGIRHAAEMDLPSRKRLGELARAFVLKSFTWDKNVEAVMDALHAVRSVPSQVKENMALQETIKA